MIIPDVFSLHKIDTFAPFYFSNWLCKICIPRKTIILAFGVEEWALITGYLPNHAHDIYQIFSACCPCSWLGPPPAC